MGKEWEFFGERMGIPLERRVWGKAGWDPWDYEIHGIYGITGRRGWDSGMGFICGIYGIMG